MEEGEERDQAIDEMKQWIKENSKKVKYKVLLKNNIELISFLETLIDKETISKEYL